MYTTYKELLEQTQSDSNNVFLLEEYEINEIWEKKWIKRLSDIVNEISKKESERIIKEIREWKSISIGTLWKLEMFSIGSSYEEQTIKNLQFWYRLSNFWKEIDLPFFYISIPVADRDVGLTNLLDSINEEILLFWYPKDKVIVNIFNDWVEPIDKTVFKNYVFKTNVWNSEDQLSFLNEKYPKELLTSIYWKLITNPPKDKWSRHLKWSWVVMNIARLILNKIINEKNSLIRFIDSDQEFSILIKRKWYFERIPNAFSVFHSYAYIFNDKNVHIATWKVVWDPAFSATQMIRTQLLDMCHMHETKDLDLKNNNYYHENRSYNDLDFFSRDIKSNFYEAGFPYLPYIDKRKEEYHPFYNILFWHHVTRPMLYHIGNHGLDKNGVIEKNIWTGNIIRPWNVVLRKDMLKYPTPFVCNKIRLHWPIFWYLLDKMNEKIYTVNIPCYHKRVADPFKKVQEYRWWLAYWKKYINLSNLRIKQIEWDIILAYFKEKWFNWNGEFDKDLFADLYKKIVDINIKNIDEIKKFVSKITDTSKDTEFLIWSIKESLDSIKLQNLNELENSAKSITNDIKNLELDLKNWFSLIKW